VYTGGVEPPPEESAAVLQSWTDWFGTLGENLVDGGNPISPAMKSINSDGMVSDSAVGERATGYSIIKADSLDAATEAAKACPHLKLSESCFTA
jgi:hypothetical protein